MDYEKKYKDALEQLKGLIEGTREDKCAIMEEDIIGIFPELAESDDERIIKALVEVVSDYPELDLVDKYGVDLDKILKWLEKQGEPKPKWTEEDEENFRDIIGAIHTVAYQTTEDEESRIDWIKSLKQRIIK